MNGELLEKLISLGLDEATERCVKYSHTLESSAQISELCIVASAGNAELQTGRVGGGSLTPAALSLDPPTECRVWRLSAFPPRAVFGRTLPAADGSAACPGLLGGGLGAFALRRGGADRVRAGQAARAGGPHACVHRFSRCCSRWCPSGRWRTRWPRPRRAVRAGMVIRSRRIVAVRAFA